MRADRRALEALRAVFTDYGFTEESVSRALGSPVERVVTSAERPYFLRRLGEPSRFTTLVKLFVIDAPVADEPGIAELAPILEDLGLGQEDEHGLRSRLRIAPFRGVHVGWDWESRGVDATFVSGINGTSRFLADLTIRSPSTAAADIGTGSGIQALLAARHSDRVVATDISDRALAVAGFNAALNDVSNIEFRSGDLLEPIGRETFDLIVTNPPFVISPEQAYEFRDGGRDADGVTEELVRGLGDRLDPGGVAQFLGSWMRSAEQSWHDRIDGWIPPDCDAVVVHLESLSPLDHAARWNLNLRADGAAAVEGALGAWTRYLEAKGAEEIVYGAGLLRKTGGRGVVIHHALEGRLLSPAGDQFDRILGFLEADATSALLDRSLAPSAQRLVHERLVGNGTNASGTSIATLDGLGTSLSVDDTTVALVALLDGRRSLREAAAELARLRGFDRDRFEAMCLEVIRGLGYSGLLRIT